MNRYNIYVQDSRPERMGWSVSGESHAMFVTDSELVSISVVGAAEVLARLHILLEYSDSLEYLGAAF